MKKTIGILICIFVIALLAGCGSTGSTSNTDGSAGQDGTDTTAGTTEHQGGVNPNSDAPDPDDGAGAVLSTTEGVDVDLTTASSTIVYSEVYNMLSTPDDYIGKIVKMNGQLASYHDEDTGKDYYACIIEDATACCQQGIEFELSDGYEYPKDGTDVTVVGKFETYKEGEDTYCTLKGAELTK